MNYYTLSPLSDYSQPATPSPPSNCSPLPPLTNYSHSSISKGQCNWGCGFTDSWSIVYILVAAHISEEVR